MVAAVESIFGWVCILLPWAVSMIWIISLTADRSTYSRPPELQSGLSIELHYLLYEARRALFAPFICLALIIILMPTWMANWIVYEGDLKSLQVMEVRFVLDVLTAAVLLVVLATTEGANIAVQLPVESARLETLYRRDPRKHFTRLVAAMGFLGIGILFVIQVLMYQQIKFAIREDYARYTVSELAGDLSQGRGCETIVERAFKALDAEAKAPHE